MFGIENNSVKKRSIAVAVSLLFALQPICAAGLQLESSSEAGHAYSETARNGVPVVNIAKPRNGISHNRYINFNVSKQGLILNNGNSDTQTKLGGIIYGNPNVKDAQASTILNEVTGSSRSHIDGYIEVAGKSADVIVVNPRGITVNGGGFINTPKATLDAKGSDISVEGKGLDGSTTALMSLKGNRVKINANIYAKKLSVEAGSGGIDSSALGGLYANVITLRSGASGIGVNLAGDILSQKSLSIDSKGDIVLNKAVSKGSADIKSRSGTINVKKGLYAKDLTLDAKRVDLKGNTGASRNLTIRTDNLTNDSILAAGVNADFSEGAAGVLTLDIANAVINNDTLFGKSGIVITSSTLYNAKGAVILTNSLNTNVANGITNDGNIFTDGKTSVEAGSIDNNGSIHSGGDLSLSSKSDIDNDEGTIESLGKSEIDAKGDIRSNDGVIYSEEAATLRAENLIGTQSSTIVNGDATLQISQTTDLTQGTLQSRTLNIHTQDLDVQKAQITSVGTMRMDTENIQADSSLIYSQSNVDIVAQSQLSNDNHANLYADGDIHIEAGLLSHTDASVMHSSGDMKIEAGTLENRDAAMAAANYSSVTENMDNQNGIVHASQDIDIVSTTVQNQQGRIEAEGAQKITTATILDNTQGEIYAKDTLQVIGGDVTNDKGVVASSEGKTAITAKSLQSSDGMISGAGVTVDAVDIRANRSTVVSSENIEIYAAGDVEMEHTTLYAATDNRLDIAGDAALTASTVYSDTAEASLSASSLYAERLKLSAKTHTQIRTSDETVLDQSDIAGEGSVTLDTAKTSLNGAALYSTDSSVTVYSKSLQADDAALRAKTTLAVHAESDLTMRNSELVSNDTLTLSAGESILDNSTLYSATGEVNLETANLSAAEALISGATAVHLNTVQSADLKHAEISAEGNVHLTSGGVSLLDGSTVYSTGGSTLLKSGIFEGNGTLLSAGRDIDIKSGADTTFVNAEFVAGDAIVFNTGVTTLENAILYGDEAAITLNTERLGMTNSHIETGERVSLNARGDIGLYKGTLKAGQITVDASGDVEAYEATLLSDTTVKIDANSLSHSNGYVAAEKGMGLTLASYLSQSDHSSIYAFDSLNVNTKRYHSEGDSVLYAKQDLHLNAGEAVDHTDNSRILSDASLYIDTETMNQTDALTSGETANTVRATSFNSHNAVMLGESNLTTDLFTNTGGFASNSSTFTLTPAIALNNHGLFSVNGDLVLETPLLDNSNGRIESGGDVYVESDRLYLRSGTLFATKNLVVESALSGMNSSSKILSGGGMDLTLKGTTYTAGEIISNALGWAETRIIVEGSLVNRARLNAGADLYLRASSVTNTNRIQSGGDMKAVIGGGLYNSHFFTSGGNMDVSAASVNNTGGLASGGVMLLRTGNIDNAQTIYSARDMNLFASGSVTNTNTIHSGGSLYMSANGSITNRYGTLESYGDMMLSTGHFSNIGAATITSSKVYYNFITQTEMSEEEMLAWMDRRDDPSRVFKYWHSDSVYNRIKQWFKDRDLFEIATRSNNGDEPGKPSGAAVWTEFESRVDGTVETTPSYVISGSNMVINAGTIDNKDAIISSGGNMHFNAGSVKNVGTFVEVPNEEVSHAVAWYFEHHTFSDNKGQVYKTEYTRSITGSTIIESPSEILVGGRFTGNIGNFENGASSALALQYTGAPDSSVSKTTQKQASVSGDHVLISSVSGVGNYTVDPKTGRIERQTSSRRASEDMPQQSDPDTFLVQRLDVAPVIYNPQEHLSLPDNPYGVFVTNASPEGPLIVFNPEYINYNNYVSSDYLLEHLGYKGDQVTRRLGDGMYETQLVRNTMMVMTGQRYANDAQSDAALYINLLDGGVKLASEVGLKLGVAPTQAQIARASEDFVWLVKENVGGHTVLVPKVYLAHAYDRPKGGYIHAKKGIDLNVAGMTYNSGTLKTDGAMRLKTGTLINEWGSLEAAKSLSVDSVSDIANLSGTIKGGSVSLVSHKGSIYNKTLTGRTTFVSSLGERTRVTVGQGASITAVGGSLRMDAGSDIINAGAKLHAGGSIDLHAGRDIGIYTVASEERFDYKTTDGSVSGSKITNLQSSLAAGGSLSVNAGGNAVFEAANITSHGANIGAGGYVQFLAASDVDYRESSSSHEDALGEESAYALDLEKTILGTTLNTGNTAISAGRGMLMQAVTGKVGSLTLNTPLLTLQSLNNVSNHERTGTTNGILTTTTDSRGSNVQTVAATDLAVGGSFSLNGEDLTSQLYNGVLTSQAENYQGYSSSAIETIQTEALNQSWHERTTSLNAVGQLVVQAVATWITAGAGSSIAGAIGAGSNAVVSAAVQSVVHQFASAALGAVVTGGNFNLDMKQLVKGVVTAGLMQYGGAALDAQLDLPKDPTVIQQVQSSVSHAALDAGITTAVYGGSYSDALLYNLAGSATDAGYRYVGDAAFLETLGEGNSLFEEGGLGKVALHSGMGALGAALMGGDIASGAAAGAARELLSPLTADAGEGTQLLVSKLTGIAAGAIAGSEAGALTGSDIATSAELNNRQLHQREIAWIKEHAEAFAKELYGANPTQAQVEDAQARLAQQALRGVDKDWSLKLGTQTDTAAKAFLETNNAHLFEVKNLHEYLDGSTDGEKEISSYSNKAFDALNSFYLQNIHRATSTNPLGASRFANEAFANEKGVIDALKEGNIDLNEALRQLPYNVAEGLLNLPDTLNGAGNYLDAAAPTTNQERLDTLYGSHTDGSMLQADLATEDALAVMGLMTGAGSLGKAGLESFDKSLVEGLDGALDVRVNPLDGTENKSSLLNEGPNGGKVNLTEYNTEEDGKPIFKRDSGEYFTYDENGKQVRVNSPKEHGNSASSTNEQHGYYIIDTDTGKRVKVGVSGQPLKSNGSSPRAQSQVDKLNEQFKEEKFTHEVVKKVPSGENARKEILEWEKQEAEKLRKNNEIDPKIHQKP